MCNGEGLPPHTCPLPILSPYTLGASIIALLRSTCPPPFQTHILDPPWRLSKWIHFHQRSSSSSSSIAFVSSVTQLCCSRTVLLVSLQSFEPNDVWNCCELEDRRPTRHLAPANGQHLHRPLCCFQHSDLFLSRSPDT